jgi:hypothetical protein
MNLLKKYLKKEKMSRVRGAAVIVLTVFFSSQAYFSSTYSSFANLKIESSSTDIIFSIHGRVVCIPFVCQILLVVGLLGCWVVGLCPRMFDGRWCRLLPKVLMAALEPDLLLSSTYVYGQHSTHI